MCANRNTLEQNDENEIFDHSHFRAPELVEEFSPERRELAIRYRQRSRYYRIRLWILSGFIGIIVLFSRISVHFRGWIIESISADSFLVVAIFFSIGFFLLSIGELPINFYLHSQLGRKFGLSKLSNRRWVWRYAKRSGIGYIISIIIFEVFYWVLRNFPNTWWIGTAVTSLIFSIILTNLAPIVILPRFYNFKPLAEEYPTLAKELLEMINQEGVKITEAYIWNLGEISTTGNAALFGLGNTRRIIISDTMLEQSTAEEIKWILAHELAHFKHKDLWKGILFGSMASFFMFFLTAQFFSPLAIVFGYSTDIAEVGSFPILGLSFWLISVLIINLPSLWYSRRVERAADTYATILFPVYKPIRSLFIKLADQNLADINPPRWETLLFASHPPIQKRIEAAQYQISQD